VTGFFVAPDTTRYALRHVRAPACLIEGADVPVRDDGLAMLDIVIDRGRIADLAAPGAVPAALGPDLQNALIWPGMADVHTHLDKGHIWPRAPNPNGTAAGALKTVAADRTANWAAEDVRRRMEFAVASAYARGVVAIRTHLDSQPPQAAISFPVFREVRDRWAGRITLQCSSILSIDMLQGPYGKELADYVAESDGNLGCATRLSTQTTADVPPEFDAALERLFVLAEERNLDLDLHVDESGELGARTLVRVARMASARRFKGRILCGHCCSIAIQPEAVIEETLAACADAGIDVVSLPMCNMYLQGRATGVTPRWRGVTLLHEMKARGMRVAVAGDNARDPFYAYGDHDMLETFVQAVRILQLDHPVGDWPRAAAATPGAIMKLDGVGVIRVGVSADLIVLRARSYSEMLSRNQADRVVIRAGRTIDSTPPDYRILDDLVGPP
jgi:cytosine deaminase